MSQYQDFYNQQREWKGSSNQQNRKSNFKNARKERRTRMFDLFRGDIAVAAYVPEVIQPTPKNTFRDTIGKLLRDKKQKVTKKLRPFVVGTVKHKIHSPPFLHGPLRNKSPKKKLLTPLHVKSFAPMNYKFRGPKGLKTNLFTPLAEEKTVMSPFMLSTLWDKLDDKTTRKKDPNHDNVTVRTQKRKPARLNSSSSSVFSTGTIPAVHKDDEYTTAKRELWPEDEDDEPIFGRLNIIRKRLSSTTMSKDNEKEDCNLTQEGINHSVNLDSSFQRDKEVPENLQSPNSSRSCNVASTSYKPTEYPDVNTPKVSDKSELEQSIAAEESTEMGSRVSQISPPKAIFSNTISKFDNTIIAEEDSLCSTPIVPSVSKITSQQAKNKSDTPIPSLKLVDGMIALDCLSPIYNNSSKDANEKELLATAKKSLLMDNPMSDNVITATASIESPSDKTLTEKETGEELSPCCENTMIENTNSKTSPIQESPIHQKVENINSTTSPVQEPPIHHRIENINSTTNPVQEPLIHQRIENINSITSPIQESPIHQKLENINSTTSPVQELPIHQRIENINSTTNPVQEPLIHQRIENIDSITSPIQESPIHHNHSKTEDNNAKISPEKTNFLNVSATENAEKVLNSTYTKYSAVIEEDEENEELEEPQLNLEKSQNQDKRKDECSSPSRPTLNSSNINEENAGPKNLNNVEHGLILSDDKNTSKLNASRVNENNDTCKSVASPLANTSLNKSHNNSRRRTGFVHKNITVRSSDRRSVYYDSPAKNVANTETIPEDMCMNVPQISRSSLTSNCSDQRINAIPENDNTQESTENQPDQIKQTDPNKDESLNSSSKNPVRGASEIGTEHNTLVIPNEVTINSSSGPVSEEINPNKDDSLNSSLKTPVKDASGINTKHNTSVEPNDYHSQALECESSPSCSDSSSTNDPTVILAQPINVNHENPETTDNSDNSKASCRKPKCDKLCCHVDAGTPNGSEKENGLAAKALDVTDIANSVSNKTLNEIHTPDKVPSLPTVSVTTPTGLEKILLSKTANNEDAHAGTKQSRVSVDPVPVINLTDSPMESVKKMSMKPALKMSALDYKSPLLMSIQKRNPLLSGSDENALVDLISDEEEDYTSFVHRVLKKHARTSNSPHQSPTPRTPLASIGNISVFNMSTRQTPQSPLVNSPAKKNIISPAKSITRPCITPSFDRMAMRKEMSPLVNSPAKKTPASPIRFVPTTCLSTPSKPLYSEQEVPQVELTVETPVEKAQVLHDTPRKTPRRRNVVKNIATEPEEVPSPLRVMSLRTRNISVSPSPKKVTPRNAAGKRKAAKESLSPKEAISQIDTLCKSPIRPNVVKEVAVEVNEDSRYLRVMSLRSRNVSVSPSPKKMTHRRRKNDNQRV